MDKLEEALKELKNFDLYEILEIEKTDDQEIIKKAYKKLIKKHHPDKNKESNTVEKFDRIKLAYELLKNFELKALYDNKKKIKQEKILKKKEMNSTRRKFMEDLEKKEKINYNKKENEENFKKDFSNNEGKNKYKHHEEEYNKFFENLFNKTETIKNKITIEDKLDKYGLKIKWRKDIECIFTKEIIKTYFKGFGNIEEIILLEKEFKAMLLFTNDKSLRAALVTEDVLINKLFKLKKYSKKEIEKKKESTEFLKHKFFDNDTIELLKNKRFMSNLNFMGNEENHKKAKKEEKIEQKEEIKKDLDFNLDLENMEKMLFEKINQEKI